MAHGGGNRPIPAAIKILKATGQRAERLRKRELKTPGGIVDPPKWMNADQKAAWAYVIANAPQTVLKRIDKSTLASFILAEDTHRLAAIAVNQEGLLVASPRQGILLQNPYLAIMNRQAQLMLRAATELGFTPVSRARIESGRPPEAAANDWDDVATA